jgi:hypothetical protein
MSYAETLPQSAPQPVKVPIFDRDGREATRHVGVALRYRDGSVSAPVSVVGARFSVPDLHDVGASLDVATAPIGGFARLGPARVRVTGARLSVVLGREESDALALRTSTVPGDPSARAVFLRLDSAFDGSAAETLDLMTVRILCKNGLVGFGSIGGMRHRHSSGLDDSRREWSHDAAHALPEALADMDRLYRSLRESVRLPRFHTANTIAQIVGQGAPSYDGLGAVRKAQADRIIDLIIGADGTYVPAPIHGSDTVDGLQILEACTAYDRHYARGDETRRRERVFAGQAIGSRALSWGVRAVAALEAVTA